MLGPKNKTLAPYFKKATIETFSPKKCADMLFKLGLLVFLCLQ